MAVGPHDPEEPGEKSARPPDARSDPSGAGEDGGGSRPSTGPAHDASTGTDRDPEDIDARWQQIVADLRDLEAGVSTELDRPGAPDDARPGRGGEHDVDRPGPDAVIGAEHARPAPPAGYRSWHPDPATEEAEDHFVPPDPGPVLGGDPLLTMAWVAAVGVPVLLIVVGVVWRDVPMSWLAGAGAVFLAGVGLLLWRMPHGDDEDPYDDDPGAVV